MAAEILRIFVSSPDDVKDERSIVKDIIERLRIEYEPYFDVQATLWENEAIVATSGFQEALVDPGTCDIVLVIFWSKLGTPLPKTKFEGFTGTEWEFINAIEHSHQHDGIPQVLVYRKNAPMIGDFFDERAVRQARTDKERLDAFFQQHFFNLDGSFKRAYRTFQDQNEFANLVNVQLHKLLDQRKGSKGNKVVWKNSPFRGLKPFEFEHHAIFFGRDQAKRYLLKKLAKQVERGIAFVMVQAMSGSGKSSLVKAGLLPQLATPRVIGDVAGVRWCIMRPSDGEDNPLRAIAQAIMRPDTLGAEMPEYGVDEAFIIKAISTDPALLKPSLQVALGKIAEERYQTKNDVVRLIIVVDQFEELFSQRKIPQELKHQFIKTLDSLARSGMVWVIGTMRSDFLHETEAYPELQALMEGDGQFHLFPPRPEEIEQMIREPAKITGLEFEARGGSSLDEILLKDASHQQGGLPLLEFTLDALYERREQQLLTFAAYESIGGLAGAVADRAEKVYNRLSPKTQQALSPVFRALVTINTEANESVTARRADWTQLSKIAENKAFIDAFINAHLLVSDQASTQEKQVVWVAHEALLRNWPRVAKWVETNIEDLRARSRIAATTALWEKQGRNDQYLLAEGKQFAEAIDLLNRVGSELEQHEREFIHKSDLRIRATRSRERLKVGIGISLIALSLLAIGGLYFTFNFSLLAMRSIDNNRLAKADEAVDNGNTPDAISLARAANLLPRQSSYVLSRAISSNHMVAMINNGKTKYASQVFADFSPDLHSAITHSPHHGKLVIWKRNPSKTTSFQFNRIPTQWDDNSSIINAVFTPDGKNIVGVSASGTWVLPADGSKPNSSLAYPCRATAESNIKISANGRWAALAYQKDNAGTWLCLMNMAQSGHAIFDAKIHTKRIRSLAFSPDSRFLSTSSEDFSSCLMSLPDPSAQPQPPPSCIRIPYTRIVNRAVFDSESHKLAIASVDGKTRIFSLNQPCLKQLSRLSEKHAPMNVTATLPDKNCTQELEKDYRGKKVHLGAAIRDVAFSNTGKAAVTVGDDAKVVYWDLSGKQPKPSVLGQHDQGIDQVSFNPDDNTLLTGSRDRTARLWGLNPATPGQLAVFRHNAAVTLAKFSSDGKHIGTVSTDGTARVWDTQVVKRTSALMTQHTDHVWFVEFDPNQGSPNREVRFATTSFDKTAIIWNYTFDPENYSNFWTLRNSVTLQGHRSAVRSAQFSSNGKVLATASKDGSARLWNAKGTSLCELIMQPDGQAVGVEKTLFGSNDDWLLTQSKDNKARIWNISKCTDNPIPNCGCTLEKVLQHDTAVQSAAVTTKNKSTLAATADQSNVLLWDTQTWQEHCRFSAAGTVTDLQFSPDQKILATATQEGRAMLWRTSDCSKVATLDGGHAELVYSIRFDPSGEKLITASQDQTAIIWSLNGKLLAKLVGHADRIYLAEFNIDGSWALTASRDGTTALWKIQHPIITKNPDQTIKPWMLLEGHRGGVSHARFSPDGRFVATAYWNNAAEIWHVLRNDHNGIEPITPDFAARISQENRLQDWNRGESITPELNWRDEVMIAIKRLWD